MSGLLKPLSELVVGWDPSWPQSGVELWEANTDDLDPLCRELRRHIASAVRSNDQVTFAGPADVRQRIEAGHIRPKWQRWETLALDERRHRIMVPDRAGGMRAQRWVTRKVPNPDDIAAKLPLPPGGCYILFYWGSPSILTVRDNRGGGVSDDLAQLAVGQKASVWRDVIFWDDSADTGGLYSLAAQVGSRNGHDIDFPDPAAVAAALGTSTTAPAAATSTLPTGPTQGT